MLFPAFLVVMAVVAWTIDHYYEGYIESLPGWLVIGVWVFANCLDFHSTDLVCGGFGQETNPLVRWYMDALGPLLGLAIFKVALTLAIPLALLKCRVYKRVVTVAGIIIFFAAVFNYTGYIMYQYMSGF